MEQDVARSEAPAERRCDFGHLPNFLTRRALHAKLKPELTGPSFNNWLARARAKWGFPDPVSLSPRSVAWDEQAVLRWISSRPRGGRFDGRRRTSPPEAA